MNSDSGLPTPFRAGAPARHSGRADVERADHRATS
ncbi:hypothetical protein EDD40_7492 [Saccharothrix texasensis]|uniref:Uncharacterized protein n=1 Tax=Saccharothrix texasensis TaxID=103734 RepID=A0A3N1HHP0_9PSEU|nr:hypothetical protein EDD40_7492 [Saccharothrix texasensis]